MTAPSAALARATSDADDRLVSADEPFARLQLRCGGELPGTIAIPALLEAVRKSRRYELKLAREIVAQNGEEKVTAWVEVEPREDGELGCDIVLRHWQARAAAGGSGRRNRGTARRNRSPAGRIDRAARCRPAGADGRCRCARS